MTAPQKRPSPFGPAVIGEKAAKRSAKVREIRADKFGPSVLGYKGEEPAPAETEPVVPVADQVPSTADPSEYAGLSIKGVEKALESNPDTFDMLFVAELHRPEGARKGSLRLFLKAEEAQDKPRAAVLDQLENLLAP